MAAQNLARLATQTDAAFDFDANRERLVAEARALFPLLRKNAQKSDDDRRLPTESAKALRSAGFFKIAQPRRCGGFEASVRTYIEVCIELARADSSAGWVTMILNGGCYVVGLFDDGTRNQIWGKSPDNAVCGVLTPPPDAQVRRVDGGFVVSARWPYATGSHHAQWAITVFNGDRGNGPEPLFVMTPMSELSIEDTWYVAGMRGTGSNTLVGKDVFMPDARTLSAADILGGRYRTVHRDETLYQSAAIAPLVLVTVCPLIGIAQAAFDLVLELMKKQRPIAYTFYGCYGDAPSFQLHLADAANLIDSARLHIMRSADILDQHARMGTFPDELTRARVRMDTGYVAECCRRAMDLLMNVAGAGGFAQVNPLQRLWRDVGTGSRHGYVATDMSREVYSRALLGRPQVSALL